MAEVESWRYHTVSGESFVVKRETVGNGKRIWREPNGITGPYMPLGHDKLPPDGCVIIVEGETCVEAVLRMTEFAATTWPGGAGAVMMTNWDTLAGRNVILWPDRDEAGFSAMEKLAAHLFDLGCEVSRIEPPSGGPDGWDAADATPEQANQLIDAAKAWQPDWYPEITDDWARPGKGPEFLVSDWLPAGRVTLFSGKGGSGKSKLALQLAAAVAANKEWMHNGPQVRKSGTVVYVSWEDGRDDLRYRLNDWPAIDGGDPRKVLPKLLGDRLVLLDCARSGPAWGPTHGQHVSTTGQLLPAGEYIRHEAQLRGARLLVLDPLAAAFACNENDRALVRRFMSDLDGWARSVGCSVLVVSHPPKSAVAEYSGSTDWHSSARAVWTMGLEQLPDDEGTATKLEMTKSNSGRKPEPLRLDDWKWWKASPWPAPAPKKRRSKKEDVV